MAGRPRSALRRRRGDGAALHRLGLPRQSQQRGRGAAAPPAAARGPRVAGGRGRSDDRRPRKGSARRGLPGRVRRQPRRARPVPAGHPAPARGRDLPRADGDRLAWRGRRRGHRRRRRHLAAILLTVVTAPRTPPPGSPTSPTRTRGPVGRAGVLARRRRRRGGGAILARWFDDAYAEADAKRRLLAAVAALPGDEPFRLLLDRFEQKFVPAAVLAAAGRFPARALRLLATDPRRGVRDVLRAHVLAHPAVVERVLPTLPDDAAGRVRAILNETVARCPGPAERCRRSCGVRRGWSSGRPADRSSWTAWSARTRRPRGGHPASGTRGATPGVTAWPGSRDLSWESMATRLRDGRANWWEAADFYVRAPEEIARPTVADWRPKDLWDGESWMPIVVGRFELDALPAALDAARRSPATRAGALLPVRGPRDGRPDGRLARPAQVGAARPRWLVRPAPGGGRPRRWCRRRSAGPGRPAPRRAGAVGVGGQRVRGGRSGPPPSSYGPAAAAAIDDAAGTDPLRLLPGPDPKLPEWADPALLPPVRLRGGAGALPADAVRHVVTILAMSKPRRAVRRIAVVRRTCEPAVAGRLRLGAVPALAAAGAPVQGELGARRARAWSATTRSCAGSRR